MKKQWQNKSQYDAERKAKDAFYKESKNARSLISNSLRKYLRKGKVSRGTRLETLLGIDPNKFFKRLEVEAQMLGMSLANDYGVGGSLEIDHTVPVSVFGFYFHSHKATELQLAIETCFDHKNLKIKDRSSNRRHEDNRVIALIKNRRFAKAS